MIIKSDKEIREEVYKEYTVFKSTKRFTLTFTNPKTTLRVNRDEFITIYSIIKIFRRNELIRTLYNPSRYSTPNIY